jgi:phosphomannomutase
MMPEISRFFGIIIRMYFDEHQPPHFHAAYSGMEAQVGIQPIRVLRSNLSGRAASLVVEWAALHQEELLDNWSRLRNDQPARKLPPLT